jgi:hypothetical protein
MTHDRATVVVADSPIRAISGNEGGSLQSVTGKDSLRGNSEAGPNVCGNNRKGFNAVNADEKRQSASL